MQDIIQKDRRCGHGPATHPRLFDISSFKSNLNYRIVAISSPSRIEAHAGLFKWLMKGIFDPNVL